MLSLGRYLNAHICLDFSVARGQYFPGYYPSDQVIRRTESGGLSVVSAEIQSRLKIARISWNQLTTPYNTTVLHLDLVPPQTIRLTRAKNVQEQVLMSDHAGSSVETLRMLQDVIYHSTTI